MLIGFDANEANIKERVGCNEFAFQVLQQLFKQGNNHHWTIYLSSAPMPDLPKPKTNWKYRILKPEFFWTQWRLPVDLWIHQPRPDLFLTLGHYAPRFSPIPSMICIMDLAFLKFPETFRRRDLWQLTNWTKYSVKKAKHIFAISEATKKDIASVYHVSAGKISLAYPGVGHLATAGTTPVKGKYLLYVGTLQPRKNLDALISSITPLRCNLVVAGKIGWKYQPQTGPEINYLGYVPDNQLGILIKNSQGLILPSLYEGFGIPVVQAMSLGVPVLVSRNSSLPEIVGDCGLYIEPPFDVPAIRDGLKKLLALSAGQRQVLSQKAKQRAKIFKWTATGRKFLEVINGFKNIA